MFNAALLQQIEMLDNSTLKKLGENMMIDEKANYLLRDVLGINAEQKRRNQEILDE